MGVARLYAPGWQAGPRIIPSMRIALLLCTALLLLGAGCGGAKFSAAPAGGGPSFAELQARLAAEFARLGIDPDKVAAAAPTGAENAVFDLAAVVIDPDGPPDGQGGGELPPAGIELNWTERLVGDYDQNGEVNISDLSPISAYWNGNVAYDAPPARGGFALWPAGDPDAAGAENWRKARIDGDGNGLIFIYEISPIAAHWQQTLSGYRVYRKAPGESGFNLIDPAGSPDGYTVAHSSPPTPQDPVRYSLTDTDASPSGLGAGIYAYYVAPYDAATDTLGAASGVVYVNTQSGEVNQAPVAALAVSPDFSGAPATITLDASGSYDLDGSIAAYNWDFDADGTWDWLSTDPLPTESSNGTVTEITQGATPGIITASYNQGSAAWLYPRVAVVDDEAAASNVASAKLGLSGWERELVSSTDDAAVFQGEELCFSISGLAEDPQTHELVAAGFVSTTTDFVDSALVDAVYFARRGADGGWTQEIAVQPDDPVWHHDFATYSASINILWDTNSQPLLVIAKTVQIGFALEYWSLSAQRSPAGTWDSTFLYGGADGKHGGVAYPVQSEAGRFIAVASDETRKIYLYTYESGVTALEDTGFDPQEREYQQVHDLVLDHDGVPFMMIEDNREDAPYRLNYWKRLGPELWEEGHFDDGSIAAEPRRFSWESFVFDSANNPVNLGSYSFPGEATMLAVYYGSGGAFTFLNLRSGTHSSSGYTLLIDGEEYMVLSNERTFNASFCDRIEGDNIISETIYPVISDPRFDGCGVGKGMLNSSGTAYCILSEDVNSETGENTNVYLSHRVDPRL